MFRPRASSAALVVALAAALAFGGAATPASAAPVSASVPPGEFIPSGNKARAYIINTLGSVLKAATPNKWKREMIANQSQYNYGWDQLAAQLGSDGPKNGNYRKSPNTYSDAILNGIEKATNGKNGPGSRLGNRARQMFKVPATPMGKVFKTVNGAAAVMIGAELGGWAGRGIADMQGFSPEGITCGGERFLGVDWDSTLVGADCANYLSFAEDYAENAGTLAGVTGGLACNADSSHCIRLVGAIESLCNAANTYCVNAYVFTRNSVSGSAWRSPLSAPESYIAGNLSPASALNQGGLQFQHDAVRAKFGPDAWFAVYDLRPSLDPTQLNRKLAKYKASGTAPAQAVVATTGDPERALVCEILGTNGQTYVKHSAPYRESAGALPDADCPVLPDGVFPANQWLYDTVDGKTKPLWTQPSSPEFLDWATTRPECDTGSCPMFLLKVDGDKLLNCTDLEEICRDWFTEPNKELLYKCEYGGEITTLSECNIYSGLFMPERVATGSPYSDPETGVWSGGANSKKPGSAGMGAAVRDPGNTRDCWAEGYADFNPSEWILTPVKCSLEWAFVPRPAVLAASGELMESKWKTTAPGRVLFAVAGWNLVFNVNGCGGLPFNFQYGPTSTDIGIPSACAGSRLADFAGTVRTVGTLGIIIGAGLAIRRLAGSSIGFNRGA